MRSCLRRPRDGGNARIALLPWSAETASLVSRPGCVCDLASACSMSMVALVVDDSMLIRYTVCRFLEAARLCGGVGDQWCWRRWKCSHACGRIWSLPTCNAEDVGQRIDHGAEEQARDGRIPIIIVASKASGFEQAEKRANFAIYKDIDIEAQLDKALEAVMGKESRRHGQREASIELLAPDCLSQAHACFRRKIHRSEIFRRNFG